MRRIAALTCLCAVLALGAAGCRHDGRTLRPARADQNASISTTSPSTTVGTSSIDGGAVFGAGSSTTPGSTAPPITLSAPWRDGAAIDARYTCDGADVSPALLWSPAPAGTAEIAVTLTDDDQPDAVLWVIAGLDPATTTLGEGQVPAGAIQATNDSGKVGYSGPCNASGTLDTYRFAVHFLDQQIELDDGAAGRDLRLAVNTATIASAEVTGLYSRP
jgi:Raf kinase inhibitor-like YbhB/YbcL family protein